MVRIARALVVGIWLLSSPLTGLARAQEEVYGPVENDLLFSIDAAYRYAHVEGSGSADESETFNLNAGLGYFLHDEHEIGLDLSPAQYARNEIGPDTWTLYAGPYYNYNWRTSPRTTVYAGPHVGFTFVDAGSSDDTAFTWGAHAGLRYWITPDVSFEVEPRLNVTRSGGFLGDQETFDVLFGISVRL